MDPKNKLKELGDKDTCPVAIVVRDGKFITGLRNYTLEKYMGLSVWTVPGGRCDEGETIEETLRREVLEEVGITDLSINKYAGEIPGAKEGDMVHMFICTTDQEPKLMEPEKFSEWRWMSPEEVPENFINAHALEVIKRLLQSEHFCNT